MIYYFLLADILALILVYIVCILWKNKSALSTPMNQLFYIPILISLLIIAWYLFNGSNNQIETRKNEYIAVGMKHYCDYTKVNGKNSMVNYELFTGIYKNHDGVFQEFEITKPTYYYFKNLWTGKKEIELLNDDGKSVVFIEWNKNPKTSLIHTKSEIFTNYFKTTMSLYDQVTVTEDDIKNLKLFSENRIDYVNQSNILEPRQSLVYGIQTSDSISRFISNLSSLDPEFRPILLVWEDSCGILKDKNIIKYQKSYWKGGKNNEVVFCVGINNKIDKKILWSGSFSWAVTQDLENYVLNRALKPGNILTSKNYYESVMYAYSKNYWKPRNFEEYTILGYSIMDFMMIMVCVLIIICDLVLIIRVNLSKE